MGITVLLVTLTTVGSGENCFVSDTDNGGKWENCLVSDTDNGGKWRELFC